MPCMFSTDTAAMEGQLMTLIFFILFGRWFPYKQFSNGSAVTFDAVELNQKRGQQLMTNYESIYYLLRRICFDVSGSTRHD